MIKLQIAETSATFWAIIYQSICPINQPIFQHLFKSGDDALHNIVVQSKFKTTPVGARAQLFALLNGNLAICRHVIPNHLIQRCSIKMEATGAFFFQFLFEHKLSFDTGVIGSRKPESIVACHPSVTNQNVF